MKTTKAKRRRKRKPTRALVPVEPAEMWERQPEETDASFAAFAEYRDYGRETQEARSLQKVAQRLSKSGTLIRRWSARHNWIARSGAWDGHLDALRARAAEERVLEDGRTLMAQSLQARKVLAIPVNALLQKIKKDALVIERMSVEELLPIVVAVTKALVAIGTFERLLRGESTENTAIAGVIDTPMQETPSDPGHVRRFVRAAIEAGVLDDDPGESVASPAGDVRPDTPAGARGTKS